MTLLRFAELLQQPQQQQQHQSSSLTPQYRILGLTMGLKGRFVVDFIRTESVKRYIEPIDIYECRVVRMVAAISVGLLEISRGSVVP